MSVAKDRENIFKRQSHAFGHVITGVTKYPLAACPMCLGLFSTGALLSSKEHEPEVTIEHSPPQQQTRLGAPRASCLTHANCNNLNTYESKSGRYMSDLARLKRGEPASLWGSVDGKRSLIPLVRGPDGVNTSDPALATCDVRIPLTLPDASQLTELKAAYLIAFTALGYSWAAQTALDPVRQAIRDGDPTSVGRIPLFVTDNPNPELANTVMVSDTDPILAVIGDDPQFGVLLPNSEPFSATAANFRMSFSGYAVPWLDDKWWRNPDPLAFRWDCQAENPLFLIEVVDPPEGS